MMKTLGYPFLIILCLCFQFCKKSEPGKPLPILTKETVLPPGYNVNLYHYKKTIVQYLNVLNDIIVDSTDRSKAFLIGQFSSGSTFSLASAMGIVKFSSSSNTFSQYPSPFFYATITSLYQASNGLHYIGGSFSDGTYSGCLGYKLPSSTSITIIGGVNDLVNCITEFGNDIYFTGNFTYYNAAPCSPLLFFNKTTNAPVNSFGPQQYGTGATRIVSYNSKPIIAGPGLSAYGRIYTTDGATWDVACGGGFNGICYDLLSYNGKVYAGGYMTNSSINTSPMHYVNEYNGSFWVPVGVNNLPGACNDIEIYNGTLYACGNQYIYSLDKNDNKWKSVVDAGTLSLGNVAMMKFLNGKLYVYMGYEFCELTKQ